MAATSHERRSKQPQSIPEVIKNGLCIGCGLCEAVTDGRARMTLNSRGSLRPTPADAFTVKEEQTLLASCPGVAVEPRSDGGESIDDVWGEHQQIQYAWAKDPEYRHRGSAGGALSALGAFLLDDKRANFVIQVSSDPEQPMHNRWYLSETADEVLARAGSRYAPTAPLAGLTAALARQEPFAIIAKPCDLNAVHAYSAIDARVNKYCVARLTFVCGGQSKMSKSQLVLDEHGVAENEVTLFRYRGYGNPGPTRVQTDDGRIFDKTYLEQWEDESTWDLETRCKLCPDALGEAADIAIADVWPGGAPTGEDEGFSAAIVRTGAGVELLNSAVAADAIILGDPLTPDDLNDFQPHQTRKKYALAARYRAMNDSGLPMMLTERLRIESLGEKLDQTQRESEYAGTCERIRNGRFDEELSEEP